MNKLVKMIDVEIKRVWKVFAVLIGLISAVQIIFTLYSTVREMNMIDLAGLTLEEYGKYNHKLDFLRLYYDKTGAFLMMLFASVMLIYIIFIWYREWFGKNSTIYRLLMLPTKRIYIYLSKLITVIAVFLSGVVAQLVTVVVCYISYVMIVPIEVRATKTLFQAILEDPLLHLLFPNNLTVLLFIYSVGILSIMIIFTGILFERSYGIKGIIIGMMYSVLSIVIAFAPLHLINILNLTLWIYEPLTPIVTICTIIITILSTGWMGNYLLNYKVTV